MRRPAWLLAALIGVAGCGGVQTLSFPPPPPSVAATVPTEPTLPDGLASKSEAPVPGVTTTVPVAIGPGRASLTGTVVGPAGPVAGATVEADRIVGNGMAFARTTTASNGTWSITSILGGRYRVRAWQPPTLDLTTPQILFLGDGQSQSLSLQLTMYAGPQVAASMAPGNPMVGQIDNLLIQVTNPSVSAAGVVLPTPLAGATVALTDGPEWQVYNGNPRKTNAAGEVLFEVSCQIPGVVPLSAQVGSTPPAILPVPSCAAPPTPATTTSTTVPPCPTVPSSVPPRRTTTTSTTLFPGIC